MRFASALLLGSMVLSFHAVAAPPVALLDPELGRISARCKPGTGNRHVWVFKQWHLSPSINTKDREKAHRLPQQRNQTAIYHQLEKWVQEKKIDMLVAEGCSVGTPGTLPGDRLHFNGWSIGELTKESGKPGYDEIISNVAFKLQAKFGKALRATCGDNEKLVREHLLAFSDARGIVGFLTRLMQYRNDPMRAKIYMDGVIELYHLPKDIKIDQAVSRLWSELKKALGRIHSLLQSRNESVIATLKKADFRDAVVVFGGAHADGISHLLEEQGIGCTVVEPAGYQDDEASLLKQLDELISK